MKLKINDITQTLRAVENELISLNSHTGAKTILYITCGSTDLMLQGITFSTDGIKNFMGTVMGIDEQDLVSKMEGFVVQGMQEEVTSDPSTKMQLADYFCNVVQWYKVIVEGWPENIPFTNLSQSSSALQDLEMLCHRWDTGKIYWRALSDDEFAQLCKEHEDKLESNKGKKCNNAGTSKSTTHCKQYKSAEIIADDNSNDCMEEDEGINELSGAATAAGSNPAAGAGDVAAAASTSASSHQPSDNLSGSFANNFSLPVFDYDAMLAQIDSMYGLPPLTLSSLLQ
ncbi:hypothetical protein BDR05DRAFT_944774 [Suillus weaverae]|nr:hypothetical protein BDR05DRAFT_944774 [Suillus weaverae]